MSLFVGDVHGSLEYLPKHKRFIQVGDLGVGFEEKDPARWRKILSKFDIRFIRGNHDNPYVCRQLAPKYLGDWSLHHGVLFISGAGSIDRRWRVENDDWWREEELTAKQMEQLLSVVRPDAYEIKAVVAHDAPISAYGKILSHHSEDRFRTPIFLQRVLEAYQPRIWVCGHHHKKLKFKHGSTIFHVLGIAEQREIPDVECDGVWEGPDWEATDGEVRVDVGDGQGVGEGQASLADVEELG